MDGAAKCAGCGRCPKAHRPGVLGGSSRQWPVWRRTRRAARRRGRDRAGDPPRLSWGPPGNPGRVTGPTAHATTSDALPRTASGTNITTRRVTRLAASRAASIATDRTHTASSTKPAPAAPVQCRSGTAASQHEHCADPRDQRRIQRPTMAGCQYRNQQRQQEQIDRRRVDCGMAANDDHWGRCCTQSRDAYADQVASPPSRRTQRTGAAGSPTASAQSPERISGPMTSRRSHERPQLPAAPTGAF